MKKSLTFLIALAFCAGTLALQERGNNESIASARGVIISPERRVHILYGDETGGGHHHSADKPCKSEFPENWNEDRILDTIELIAANDNMDWRQEKNGYFAGERKIDGLTIRVILNPQKTGVITAYPVNVTKNPCPANDNR